MPHKLHYDRGDRVGSGNAIYLEEVPSDGIYRKALFECDYCGKEFKASISRVKYGNTKSCGCLCKKTQEWGKHLKTHGLSNTKLYGSYAGILRSTHGVCKEWASSFEVFRAWAIANGYKEGKAILRKDQGKEFSPENCKIGIKKACVMTHGESQSFLYRHWTGIKNYCKLNEIPMDDRWSNDFLAFKQWAIANNYKPGLQIERRDRTKGITPENCYFQDFPKSNRECWLNGERMTFAEAGRRLGKTREMIRLYSTGKIKKIPEGLKFSPPGE